MASILICLLVLSNILVSVKPTEISPLTKDCTSSTSNYIEGSKFLSNLNRLLYRSLYNKGRNSIYAKASEGEYPDKVHGVFLCRGDVAPKDCQNCIDVASEHIQRECPLSKQAIIWYDECLVRYSNIPFASRFNKSSPHHFFHSVQDVSWTEQVRGIWDAMFDNLITQATSVYPNLKYAVNSDEITESQKLYGMVQCLPDLSAVDCRTCLDIARSLFDYTRISVPHECKVVLESCNLSYQFRNSDGRGTGTPPPSSTQGDKDQGGNTSKIQLVYIITGVIALLAVASAGSGLYLVKRRRRAQKEGNGKSQQIKLLSMDRRTT